MDFSDLNIEDFDSLYRDHVQSYLVDFYCYIDESGSHSLKNPSDCFSVSGIVLSETENTALIRNVEAFTKTCSKSPHNRSMKDFSVSDRDKISGILSNYDYITVHSAIYKEGIKGTKYDRYLHSNVDSYLVMLRNVVERVTIFAKKNGLKIHFYIDQKDKIDIQTVRGYCFDTGGYSKVEVDHIASINHIDKTSIEMIIADCVSYSFGKSIDVDEYGNTQIQYANNVIAETILSYNDKVWDNGLKVVGISSLEEFLEKFGKRSARSIYAPKSQTVQIPTLERPILMGDSQP